MNGNISVEFCVLAVKFKGSEKESYYCFNIFCLKSVKILVCIMKGKSDFEAVDLSYVNCYESHR